MPDDREDTTVESSAPTTTPEMPAVEPDDEATRIDPKPTAKRVQLEEDDEATKATGTPKKARAAAKMLEESRRLNARGEPKPQGPKLHPLIPLGVALVLLTLALLFINWMIVPTMGPDGRPGPSRMKTLFDW